MKNYLFDTSVIVAASIAAHPHHNVARPWLAKVLSQKITGHLASHALAEIYAVLTRLPLTPALAPDFVKEFLFSEIISAFTIVDLSTKDYRDCVKIAAKLNLKGGAFYDLLHWQACLKKNINHLLTFNLKDFQRFSDMEPGPKIVVPE
ncbi:MAG: PIN domain-containing protein [Deltaproteobacteria bacterium]|nr:PIN domain-containing protein [Deltaproteobacteria bacterium]